MAKDPAFLFYYQDFLVGTDDMELPAIGAYIRCLCHQASKGGLSISHMKKICETHEIHMSVQKKFRAGEDGLFFNERLRVEMDKRKAYTESRRLNRSKPNSSNSHMKHISETYVSHMENENENEIVIEDIGKEGVEGKPKTSRFKAPDLMDVEQFMDEANVKAGRVWNDGKVRAEAKNFWNYYEANGWRVGKNPMKKWDAAARNWMNNANKFEQTNTKNGRNTKNPPADLAAQVVADVYGRAKTST